jgi:hypothetical protein
MLWALLATPFAFGASALPNIALAASMRNPDVAHHAIGDARIGQIITMTLKTKPADATHWGTRGMAKASGVSTSVGASHLARFFLAAASRRDVQTFDRSAVR